MRIYKLVTRFNRKYPMTIANCLKRHSIVAASVIDDDEKVLYAFSGQKNDTHGMIFDTCVVVVTDKRLIIGQKRFLWGYQVTTITPKLFNDLKIKSGLFFGKVELDTVLGEMEPSDTEHPNISSVNVLRDLGIGVAGLYVNKSGKGNAGFDVRAQLVDEDYSGYVHLSIAYTKDLFEDGKNVVFVGDKLVQMMLIPVFHTQYEEVNSEEYNKIMSKSKRGDSGFGSSDVKH